MGDGVRKGHRFLVENPQFISMPEHGALDLTVYMVSRATSVPDKPSRNSDKFCQNVNGMELAFICGT